VRADPDPKNDKPTEGIAGKAGRTVLRVETRRSAVDGRRLRQRNPVGHELFSEIWQMEVEVPRRGTMTRVRSANRR